MCISASNVECSEQVHNRCELVIVSLGLRQRLVFNGSTMQTVNARTLSPTAAVSICVANVCSTENSSARRASTEHCCKVINTAWRVTPVQSALSAHAQWAVTSRANNTDFRSWMYRTGRMNTKRIKCYKMLPLSLRLRINVVTFILNAFVSNFDHEWSWTYI